MLLYFSSNGQLKEVVNDYDLLDPTTDAVLASGFLTASGSINANCLFAIFEGETPTSSQVSVTYQMPNGGIYSNTSIPATGTLSAYIKHEQKRDLTNFKAGKTYEFVKFSLNDVLAVGGEGYYRANFELYPSTSESRAYGTFEFTAQGSPSQLVKNEITDTQYQIIMATISQYLPLSGGTIAGSLTVNGNATVNGVLSADAIEFEDADLSGDLTVGGDATITGQTKTGSLKVGQHYIDGDPELKIRSAIKTYIETDSGILKIHNLTNNPSALGDATSKEYVETRLNTKVSKLTGTGTEKAYTLDASGNQSSLEIAATAKNGTLAKRTSDGKLVSKATESTDSDNTLVTKGYAEDLVEVSSTGTSTTEAKYITVNGNEWKLGETPDLTDYATTDYVDDADDALSARIDAVEGRGRYLSGYDCSTGEATTIPPTAGPYAYKTGDYFIVSNVGTGTKYIPSGATYDPSNPAKQAYTGAISINDNIIYDGTSWSVQHTQAPVIPIANESAAGLVKSTSSTISGSVSVSETGTMTVNGWATLVKLSQASAKQVFVRASALATTASGIDYSDTATASSIAQRTSEGKLKAVTPTSSDEDYTVATKEYVDDAVGGIDLSGYVSKSSASSSQVFAKSPTAVFGLTYGSQNTASTLILRDSDGKAQITSPSSSDPDATIANKGYVNAQISASLGDIESALDAIIGHTE